MGSVFSPACQGGTVKGSAARMTYRRVAFVFAIALIAAVSAMAITRVVPAPAKAAKHRMVVVIDAGHQGKADNRLEPIGPGSKKRKPRVTSGTSGVATHKPESLINLRVALKLRDELEKRGVKVIMIRTSQNVNIANSRRAKIANAAHADLFIRLHCDGTNNPKIKGLLTLVPANNKWTSKIVKKSARAGRDVQGATLKTTHADDRGIVGRGDMSGFNWAKVPSIIVEMGVMTNREEDRRLATTQYEARLANGMAIGVMRFLAGK